MAENGKQPPPPDKEAQKKRLIEEAKRLEVDETGKALEQALGVVTSGTPRVDVSRPHGKQSLQKNSEFQSEDKP